jgi:hypothetical protein
METTYLASDLSYLVLQKRRKDAEPQPAVSDENRRLYPLPSTIVVRETFLADRDVAKEGGQS